jgi:hypothetical protein
MKITDTTLLHFADTVSHTLSDFAHTYNLELVSKSELKDLYEKAREILAEQLNPFDED